MELATNVEQLKEVVKSDADVVRSRKDIVEILAGRSSIPEHGKVAIDVLRKATNEEVNDFISSLSFSNGALGHANFKSLDKYLDENTRLQIWGLFGISEEMATRQVDYFCRLFPEPPTCVPSHGSYCNGLACSY